MCLSGGVGGAKLARGLHDVLSPGELTVIGNVGDDIEVLGVHVSPDLDSVLYALAGVNDDERGWGRAGETWRTLDAVRAWGGDGWFRLGDLDIGLHLVRTAALRDGERLSVVTARLVAAAGLASRILPATDDRLRTSVVTPAGTFPFQEWFVVRGHDDEVDGMVFDGADAAVPADGVVEAIEDADVVVIAPSNPYTSIHPILAVDPIRARARRSARAGGGGEPADRRAGRQGPARPYAPPHGRGDVTGARRGLLPGSHRRPGDRRRGQPCRVGRAARRERDPDRRPGRGATPGRGRARGGMKVAIVGGTGSFGMSLAKRLVAAGYEVVVGSRDAGRAAEAAAQIGAAGATNRDACQDADLVVLATKAEATVATAAELREAIGTTPVLSVAAELDVRPHRRASHDGRDVGRGAGTGGRGGTGRRGSPLSRREKPRPGRAARRGRARLRRRPCGEGDRPRARQRAHVGSGGRLRSPRLVQGARGADGRDRQRQQALQDARGYPRLRRAVNVPAGTVSVIPLEGLPELRLDDDLGGLLHAAAAALGGLADGDVVVVAQKAVSKVEGRTVRLADVEPSARALELAGVDGDPRQVEVILRESREVVRSRPPLVIAETRHGFVCASAGVDASNAPDEGVVVLLPLDPDGSARRLRERLRDLTGADVGVIVSDSFGRAWRQGTTDVALGVAGITPLRDLRGTPDARGHELRTTQIAVADEIAGAAELVLGKARQVPAAIVRGVAVRGDGSAAELVMPRERDLFR